MKTPQNPKRAGMGVVSLIMAIACVAVNFISRDFGSTELSLIFGILAIIFGIIGLNRRKRLRVLAAIGAITGFTRFLILIISVILPNLEPDYDSIARNFPPITTITYTEDGESYNIEAVEGHVLIYFKDGTSSSKAKKIIKRNGGTIIVKISEFDYYLIEVPLGTENTVIANLNNEETVEFCFLNMALIPNSISIIDDFKTKANFNHGDEVTKTFLKYSYSTYIGNNSKKNTRFLSDVTNNIYKTIKFSNKEQNDLALINISVGTALPRKIEDYNDKRLTNTDKKSFKQAYLKYLQDIAMQFKKCEEKFHSNFIVTLASGNHHFDSLEVVLPNAKYMQYLSKHLILVNANEHENCCKKLSCCSNRASNYHPLITTIDKYDDEKCGTSFAAPKLLGWIDYVHYVVCPDLTAQELLGIIRNATPKQHPYEALNREVFANLAKKLCPNIKPKARPKTQPTEFIINTKWTTIRHDDPLKNNAFCLRKFATIEFLENGTFIFEGQMSMGGSFYETGTYKYQALNTTWDGHKWVLPDNQCIIGNITINMNNREYPNCFSLCNKIVESENNCRLVCNCGKLDKFCEYWFKQIK